MLLSTAVASLLLLGLVRPWINAAAAFCPHDYDKSKCECHQGSSETLLNCNNNNVRVDIAPTQQMRFTCSDDTSESDFSLLGSWDWDAGLSLIVEKCPLFHGPLSRQFHLLNPNKLEHLQLAPHRGLKDTLNATHFSGLTAVQRLNLEGAGLTSLRSDVFSEMPRMQSLSLVNNNINNLPEDLFQRLPLLKSIYLEGNQLTNISVDLFRNSSELNRLTLSRNQLTSLPAGVFRNLTNLRTLILNNNNFQILPLRLLANSHNLTTFKLNENEQNVSLALPEDLFSNMPHLQTVDLKDSNLGSLPDSIFSGSSGVVHVTLQNTSLTELPSQVFHGMISLERLDLSRNQLRLLPPQIFSTCEKLKWLDLSFNQLTNLSTVNLKGLDSLTTLRLGNNYLVAISALPSKVQILNLANNKLAGLGCGDDHQLPSPLEGCSELQRINLSKNNITSLCSEWLQPPNLKELNLSHNLIRNLARDEHRGQYSCAECKLNNNAISVIPVDVLIGGNWSFGGNPLACDHSNYDLFRVLRGERASPHLVIDVGAETLCAEPAELAERYVTSVRLLEVLRYDDSCVPGCRCNYRPYDSARVVDCSHRNLTAAPAELPQQGHNTVLLLSGNALGALPDFTLPGYQRVTELNISHNRLSSLRGMAAMPKSMKVMDLSNNTLVTVEKNVLDDLGNFGNLTKLDLRNPWRCDCNLREFVMFVQSQDKVLVARDKITCSEDGRSLLLVSLERCRNIWMMYVTPLACGCLLAIVVALFFKFSRVVKAWIYVNDIFPCLVTEEELDSDLTYDVFISYSHKDEHFVVEELMPTLEAGPHPLKLCVHIRDFVPGQNINNQIVRSVQQSRRTLFVLSPNFLESEWGRLEFRAAHRQALDERRTRVVMVLLEDVGPLENLDPELRAYLRMNTYVERGDPWFWEKLRYSLPHRRQRRGRGEAAVATAAAAAAAAAKVCVKMEPVGEGSQDGFYIPASCDNNSKLED